MDTRNIRGDGWIFRKLDVCWGFCDVEFLGQEFGWLIIERRIVFQTIGILYNWRFLFSFSRACWCFALLIFSILRICHLIAGRFSIFFMPNKPQSGSLLLIDDILAGVMNLHRGIDGRPKRQRREFRSQVREIVAAIALEFGNELRIHYLSTG